MDSINRNQPEKNREDLAGAEAGKRIKSIVEKAKNCFFNTRLSESGAATTRPMAVQEVEDDGTCWFLSASDSHKNAEIAADPRVQLLFQGATHSDFLTIEGTATVSRDKAKIKDLWSPVLKVWFTEGEDDPRITVIRVQPTSGYYWDTKHGETIAFAKQLIGAAIGKTLDDSIEGTLKP